MNMQGNLIFWGLQLVVMPATQLVPRLPCCTAGCLGMGYPEPCDAAGGCCQHAGDQEHQGGY